jgi:DNA polymerase III epsilon subunit-like protein
MTGKGIPQRNKLSPRLNAPVRDYDRKALYFRERQKFSVSQPYLDANTAVKVLGGDLTAYGSGGDREMVGQDGEQLVAEFQFDPLAYRKPGQVLKLHTTFKEATSKTDEHNWGWVDPKPEMSDEQIDANMREAAKWFSKQPQVVLRKFYVDENGNDTGAVEEIAVKGILGRTIRDMMPSSSIDLREAINKGIVIDADGRMRCPPGTPNANQFTDIDMSNCFMFGMSGIQREISRIRSFWKDWNREVAEVRAERTAKERLGKARTNYTSPEENAEILAQREQSFNDALATLGIDLSSFTPEQLKKNVHLFSALDELFKNHDGPEFRRFLHDALGFKWDDSKTVQENMDDYWNQIDETFTLLLPDEVKKALIIDPDTGQPAYPDLYNEARATLDMLIDRHRQVQDGIIRAALIEFNDNPEIFGTLREIGFDAWNGKDSIGQWMSGEAVTRPLTDDVNAGRLGTAIEVNTWALTFGPLVDMGLLNSKNARFEIDMKPVDASGTPLSDVERLKRIRDTIKNSVEVAHFVENVDYANQQSSSRASAVSGMTPSTARAMHVMFHELGHVAQYSEAQRSIIDYVNEHGRIVVMQGGGPTVLEGDWRNWSNGDWYAAINTVMQGTFDGMNYPPITAEWLEDSMLHLLAGQYYQDELAKLHKMENDGDSKAQINAQLGLIIQEARAELFALKKMGVIRGDDVDKAIGGMESAQRAPGIGVAARPIYDAPTESLRNLVPPKIFAGKQSYKRRQRKERLHDWQTPDSNWDPQNGKYADWSISSEDSPEVIKQKNRVAEQDYLSSEDFLKDAAAAGHDIQDGNDLQNYHKSSEYKANLKKYKAKYSRPAGDTSQTPDSASTDGEVQENIAKRDVPKWQGNTNPGFGTDEEQEMFDAIVDDYATTDYTIEELAERFDATPSFIQSVIDDYENNVGTITRENPPIDKSPQTRLTPNTNPKEWGRQRREKILAETAPETVALFDGSVAPEARSSSRTLEQRKLKSALNNSAEQRQAALDNANTIPAPTPDNESPLLDEEIRDAVAPMLFHIDAHEFEESMSVVVGLPISGTDELSPGDIITKSTPLRGIILSEDGIDLSQQNVPEGYRLVRVTVPAGSRGVVDGNRYNGDSDGVLLPPGKIVVRGDGAGTGIADAEILSQETPAETLKRLDDYVQTIAADPNSSEQLKSEANRTSAQITQQIAQYANTERGRGMRSRSRGESNDALSGRQQEVRNSIIANIVTRQGSTPFSVDEEFAARNRNPDGGPLRTQWGDVVPREVQLEQRKGRITASLGRMSNILSGKVTPTNEAELDFINDLDPRIKRILSTQTPERIQKLIDESYVEFHKRFDDRVRIPINESSFNSFMSRGRMQSIQEMKPNSPLAKMRNNYDTFIGYDPSSPDDVRPISGYMVHSSARETIDSHLSSVPSDGVIRNPDFFFENAEIQPMGDVRIGGNDIDIVLKPEVASRSAYTRGDAMASHNLPTPILFDQPDDVGSAHLNESITRGDGELARMKNIANALQNVIDDNFAGSLSDDTSLNRSERSLRPGNRYEALVAGGVALEDVAQIRYPVTRLDTDSETLDIGQIVGNSGRQFLSSNGFSDGEINEYFDMIDRGEVQLESARWLKQHRAAKKFESSFRANNNFDGQIIFTNSDGIDLMSTSTFADHPAARGLNTVEQMLAARMLDDMAPNLKKTLKAIRKSPDTQARIRAARVGRANNSQRQTGGMQQSRVNTPTENEVDDVIAALSDELRNIAAERTDEQRTSQLRGTPLDGAAGSRNLRSPRTFNDYVDNPPISGMRSKSGLERPRYPRKPTMGAFIGSADDDFDEARTWEEFKKILADKEMVFIDYETTGLKFDEFGESSGNGLPTQIGAVKVKNGKVIGRFNVFVNPGTPMSEWEQWSRDNLKDSDGNPITDNFLSNKPSISEAHRQLIDFIGNTELLGMQNAVFDNEVLEDALNDSGIDWRPKGIIDTKELSDMVLPKWSEDNQNAPFGVRKDGTKYPSNSLGDITKFLGVELGDKHHTADADAEATAEVMQKIVDGAIENGWSSDVLDKSKRRAKENLTREKFEKAVNDFNELKREFINAERSADDEGGMRSRTATKPAAKRTPKPKVVEPRIFRNPETENLPRSRDYYNIDDVDAAMRDILDDVYIGIRDPQDITNRVNALRDEIRELGESSGMPDDMIEDLLNGTKIGPSDVVGGFDRWGGLRSRSNIGANAKKKAGVAGRIISSERSQKALQKLGLDEDKAEAVQMLGEMAAAFSVSGPAGLGAVIARRAGRDIADFGLIEAVERGWIDQATADKIGRRMLDRVAPEGLPEDIKDIIEKGKNSLTSDDSKAKAAELLETLRETIQSGGLGRLISGVGEKTRTLTDVAKMRGRELAAEKMRETRNRAREIAQEAASEAVDQVVDKLKDRGRDAARDVAGRLRGRLGRRGN